MRQLIAGNWKMHGLTAQLPEIEAICLASAHSIASLPIDGQTPMSAQDGDVLYRDEPDPHLRSIAAVTGYHVHAKDGMIGHVENLMIDDVNWDIRYIVVDTKNFWPGKRVLLSPEAVTKVDLLRLELHLNISRETVRAKPKWNGTPPRS